MGFSTKNSFENKKHHFLVLSMRSRAWYRTWSSMVPCAGAHGSIAWWWECAFYPIFDEEAKKWFLSGIILVQWVLFLNEDFFIGLFKELEIRNPELPSKMLGGIIVCRAVFLFFLCIFFVRATIVRTSLQIMDTKVQMSFGGTIYLLLLGNTFLEIVLGF